MSPQLRSVIFIAMRTSRCLGRSITAGAALLMVILAGCGPQATSDDQYISICSDEWPISETACQQIVRASRVCPDGDRNDFLIVAQSSYALGDFSLDEAVDNAEQSICPAVEVDAEASPTTTRQSTDSGGGLDLVMAGWLTVCTDVPYPPMELKDPSAEGGFTGFDIELMRAIANDLGLDLAIATPGWDAIISGLATEAGDCDISAAAITLDESRRGIDSLSRTSRTGSLSSLPTTAPLRLSLIST